MKGCRPSRLPLGRPKILAIRHRAELGRAVELPPASDDLFRPPINVRRLLAHGFPLVALTALTDVSDESVTQHGVMNRDDLGRALLSTLGCLGD
jgi:hypothetical protein